MEFRFRASKKLENRAGPKTYERKNEEKLENCGSCERVDFDENGPEKTHAGFSPHIASIFQISLNGSEWTSHMLNFLYVCMADIWSI